MRADVIIAGASFAGLGVAYHLKESGFKVLMVDKKEIGDNRASTCGMPMPLAEKLAPKSILDSVDHFYIETPRVNGILKMPHDYCVVDYKKFCTTMFKNSGAEFMKTEVLGTAGNTVLTANGVIEGDFIVDCTGWRKALSKDPAKFQKLFSGIEITAPVDEKYLKRLNFFFDRSRIPGYGWIFPVGGGLAHVGIGGYCFNASLKKAFNMFLDHVKVKYTTEGLMSGVVPCTGMSRPIDNNIFLVGDSARQVLPLSAEGIRPTITFSRMCAETIQDISKGKMSLKDGLRNYEMKVNRSRLGFNTMHLVQDGVLNFPQIFSDAFAFSLTRTPFGGWFTNSYLAIARY